MLATLAPSAATPRLPESLPPAARHALVARLSAPEAIRLASEILMRALNAIAIDPATRIPNARFTADRRFSLALGVDGAALLARRSVDLAIDAEVLAACLQERSLVDARARAEQRALGICNPSRVT